MKRNLLVLAFTVLCFLNSSILQSQTKVIPYQQMQPASGMFFGATMNPTNITVTFEGVSDRWIALGFGSFMPFADVLMFSNGQIGSLHALGWNDYYNPTGSSVTNDLLQNWTIISTNVAAGQRTVVASRPLNTGDVNDAVISFASSSLNLIWAKGAAPNFTISYHGGGNRGFGISLPWQSQPSASFTTLSTTVCAGSSVTFSNLTTGGQTSYTWNFSGTNLASSTATDPIVTYTAPGVYSVALTASNVVGTSSITQLNYITVNPTVVPTVSVTQSIGANPICSGTPATFTAAFVNGGPAPSFQWKVNGVNVGTNSPTFTSVSLTNPAIVTCVMTANSVCAVPNTGTSSAITVTVNSSAPATVTIALTGGTNPLCNNTLATFTATPGNGGNSPNYQWKINNVNVGTNSPTFTSNTLSNANIVTCQMTSASSCATPTVGISSGITMTVSNVLVPSVSVNLTSGTNPLCAGSLLTFTATPTNGGNTPSYQWLLNGTNIGNNSAVFSSSTFSNGAVINCIMTSNSPCSNPNTGTATAITLTVNAIPSVPTVSPSGLVFLCSGKSVTLQSSATTGNLWSNGATTQSVVISSGGNYSVTQSQNGCVSPPSSIVTVSVVPSPTVIFGPLSALCRDSEPIQLQGVPFGGVYSGPGVSGQFFNPANVNTGTFVLVYHYQDIRNCVDTATASIVVLDCTGISFLGQENSKITVYPNPGNGHSTIYSSEEKIISMRVLDINGKLIYTRKVNSENEILLDISKETNGIYILELGLETRTLKLRLDKKD